MPSETLSAVMVNCCKLLDTFIIALCVLVPLSSILIESFMEPHGVDFGLVLA